MNINKKPPAWCYAAARALVRHYAGFGDNAVHYKEDKGAEIIANAYSLSQQLPCPSEPQCAVNPETNQAIDLSQAIRLGVPVAQMAIVEGSPLEKARAATEFFLGKWERECDAHATMLLKLRQLEFWMDPASPPRPTGANGDSNNVLIDTATWGMFVGWYEHTGQQWVSSAKRDGPLVNVTGWRELPKPAESPIRATGRLGDINGPGCDPDTI